MPVINGERTSRARRPGADVAYHRAWDVQATMSAKAQPECQVDVFEVTEERGIEAVHLVEGIAVNHGGCPAGREHLSGLGVICRCMLAMVDPPRQATDMI